jgi:energy-converting hydrogenase Eha subunit F
MNKVEALLKVCMMVLIADSFIWADIKNPIYLGKFFVILSVACCVIGIYAVYRDYKKDQVIKQPLPQVQPVQP